MAAPPNPNVLLETVALYANESAQPSETGNLEEKSNSDVVKPKGALAFITNACYANREDE